MLNKKWCLWQTKYFTSSLIVGYFVPMFIGKKRYGDYKNFLITISKGLTREYFLCDEHSFLKQKAIKIIEKSDKDLSDDIIRKTIQAGEKLLSAIFLDEEKIRKCSNKTLLSLIEKTASGHEKMHGIGGTIAPFETIMSDYLNKPLQEKHRGLTQQEIDNYKNILSAPENVSIAVEEEIVFLKLLIKCQSSVKKLFLDNKIDDILARLKDAKDDALLKFYNQLLRHKKNYFWVPVDIGNKPWNILDFILKAKSFFEEKNINQLLQRRQDKVSQLLAEKEKIYHNLRDDGELKKICHFFSNIGFLRDYRKSILSRALYFFNIAINEVSSRMNILSSDMHLLLPEEFKNVVVGKLKIKEINLEGRRKPTVLIFINRKLSKIIRDKKAKEIINELGSGIKPKTIDIIKGIPASPGFAKGKVEIIINQRNLSKMNKGNIMVSIMTNYDLVTGMRKAAAIITDEGGLLCHAAIVSRELGIPCIIGTKIATRVLKDGDLVEVDANKGIVKILKRKK